MTNTAPVKRGRGRPPLPRAPIEAFTDDQIRTALAEAERIDGAKTMAQLIAEHRRAGLHPEAFRIVRKLAKQGPEAAQETYAVLGRYLVAAGLLPATKEET